MNAGHTCRAADPHLRSQKTLRRPIFECILRNAADGRSLLHTARMTDRVDEELTMLTDIRAYIRTAEGPDFPISTSVIDRVLDERNNARLGRSAETDIGLPVDEQQG